MGQDILICCDKSEEIDTFEYISNEKLRDSHRLSRTFCAFMNRYGACEDEPELDQLGRIFNIDISVLYEMQKYLEPEYIEYLLENAENDEEKRQILVEAEEMKSRITGNISKVYATVQQLLDKVNKTNNLVELFEPTEWDSLNRVQYFSSTRSKTSNGYLLDNFKEDLVIFLRYLDYIKERGASTVWFIIG